MRPAHQLHRAFAKNLLLVLAGLAIARAHHHRSHPILD
jgi:hypothetical protein